MAPEQPRRHLQESGLQDQRVHDKPEFPAERVDARGGQRDAVAVATVEATFGDRGGAAAPRVPCPAEAQDPRPHGHGGEAAAAQSGERAEARLQHHVKRRQGGDRRRRARAR